MALNRRPLSILLKRTAQSLCEGTPTMLSGKDRKTGGLLRSVGGRFLSVEIVSVSCGKNRCEALLVSRFRLTGKNGEPTTLSSPPFAPSSRHVTNIMARQLQSLRPWSATKTLVPRTAMNELYYVIPDKSSLSQSRLLWPVVSTSSLVPRTLFVKPKLLLQGSVVNTYKKRRPNTRRTMLHFRKH